jgi:hypothetical protein
MASAQDLKSITSSLRKRLSEFRYSTIDEEGSIHINTVEIALGLVEYAINVGREIRPEETQWFKGGKYVDLIVGNSEWEDISQLYYDMITASIRQGILNKAHR